MDEKSRLRRRKELEEKKRKLEELRKQREADKEKGTKGTGESGNKKSVSKSEVDDILDNLDYILPDSAKKSLVKSHDIGAESTLSPSSSGEPAGSNQNKHSPLIQKRGKSLVNLCVGPLFEVDIAPKTTEMYSKFTQTIGIGVGSEDDEAECGSGPASLPSDDSKTDDHSSSWLRSSLSRGGAAKSSFFELVSDGNEEQGGRADEGEKEIEEEDSIKELTQEEKDAILASEDFVSFLDKSSKILERALTLSEKTPDITADYTPAELSDDESEEEEDGTQKKGGKDSRRKKRKGKDKQLKQISCFFNERWCKHRTLTILDWSHADLIAASYSTHGPVTSALPSSITTTDLDGLVLVWAHRGILLDRPEHRLACRSPVTSLLCPADFAPTAVVAGTYGGQIMMWDMRTSGEAPVQSSPLSSAGHTHPVYSISVVGTKNAHNLVSISTDGRMCAWSLDNLTQPLEILELRDKQQNKAISAPVAVTCTSFREDETNWFWIGSEEGAVFKAGRHGSNAGIQQRFEGHTAPVTSIHCHPSQSVDSLLSYSRSSSADSSTSHQIRCDSLVLSSSMDWSTKLWFPPTTPDATATAGSPLSSFESSDYVYDCRWSPNRPAGFATVDGCGFLDVWNLVEDVHVPISKTFVHQEGQSHRAGQTGKALSTVRWSPDGRKLAVGDSGGRLYVYDCLEASNPLPDEWHRFEHVLRGISSPSDDMSLEPEHY